MANNKVWKLVELPKPCRLVSCKWVFKTKKDSKGRIELFNTRLMAKGFTQREGTNFNETFSLVSTKRSFRIIMALIARFDLELHQMDVKTTFFFYSVSEVAYLQQPKCFQESGNKHLVCILKKSIYRLK